MHRFMHRAMRGCWLIGAVFLACSGGRGAPTTSAVPAPSLVAPPAEAIRDVDHAGRTVPLLHPPQYALHLLRNAVWQSRALAEDVRLPADDPVFAVLGEFEAALASSPAGFVQAVAPLSARAGQDAYDLAADKNYADYVRRFALDAEERELYRAAQAGFAALGPLLGTRLERAVADYQGSEDGAVHLLEDYPLDDLDALPQPGHYGFDVDVHIAEGSGTPWPVVRAELVLARALFARVGVHLRVRSARRIRVPGAWHAFSHGRRLGPPGAEDAPFYRKLQSERPELSTQALEVYRAVIDSSDRPERRLHLVCLRQGSMPYYFEDEQGTWRLKDYPVGGLSFPPYVFAERIPRPLRGIVGLFAVRASAKHPIPFMRPKTIAHELGHNLLNVSHEGHGAGPAFESYDGGSLDLMRYGFGLDIPAGEEGRWHRERLLRSPFLYRMESGRRVYNPDYRRGGVYEDPVYESFIADD